MYFGIPNVQEDQSYDIPLPTTMTGATLQTDGTDTQAHRRARGWPWRSWRLGVASVLLLGVLARLPFASVDLRPSGDVQTYQRWARAIQERGLPAVYDGGQVVYPPLLLYLFGAAGLAEDPPRPSNSSEDNPILIALLKLPPLASDLLAAALLAWALRRRDPRLAVAACGLYALNPAIWYVSAIWGQTDSVYALFLLASIVALERRAYLPAWVAYALALGTKVQGIALAPLLVGLTFARGGPRRLAAGLAAGAATWALLASPWLLSGRAADLLHVYTVPAEPPRVDVSAYNLWYLLLFGQVNKVSSTSHPAGLPLSYQQLGIALFALFALLVTGLAMRRGQNSPNEPPAALPAAALSLGLFMLLTQMHERHAFPVLAFALLWAAGTTSPTRTARPAWLVYGLLSLTFLFNVFTVAPFTPALRTNLALVQADPSSPALLKGLYLLTAAANLIVLVSLLATLARRTNLPVAGRAAGRGEGASTLETI